MSHPTTSGLEFITGTESKFDEQAFDSLDFEDVVMRVFPLKANMNRLRSFCDRYVNLPGDDIAHFAPAVPYVLLQVLNYGRMSSPSSNLGWVAQNEVVFNVPLVGHWLENGKERRDFASIAPFIFVDDEWSIATGREVYGWPKVLARLTPGINPWMKDPRSRRRLMTLETMAMSKLWARQAAENHVLLEIEQEAPQLFGQIPPNAEYLLSPMVRLPKLVLESLAAAPDFIEGLSNLSEASGDPLLTNLLGKMFKDLVTMPPKLYGNTLNLKQFRGSRSGTACYQALVNAKMQIKRFNAGGLLGSTDLMRGDPSGGYVINLHRLPAFPIIESLGLEVESEYKKEGVSVASLRPLVPCWASLDLRYERGSRICWRTEDATWVPWIEKPEADGGGVERMPALDLMSPTDSVARAKGPVPDHDTSKTSTPYNTTLGAAAVPVSGPFDFFNSSVRVLPIRAKSEKLLEAFPKGLDSTLVETFPEIEGADFKFEPVRDPGVDADADPYDSWVFLVVTTHHSMSSSTNDIGWWAKRELAFAFLVKAEFPESSEDSAHHDGYAEQAQEPRKPLYWLYWPYQFSDSPIAVTEGREVLGLPTSFAELCRGQDPWIGPDGTNANRVLLQLKTKDFPALGVGAGDIERVVLEIEGSPSKVSDSETESSLVARFREEHFPDQAGSGGSDPDPQEGSSYFAGIHFSNLSLKQFRDEENPNRACYQALVAFERGIGSIAQGDTDFELRPLVGDLSVRFHDSALWDITSALGLKARLTHNAEGSITAVCEVEEPFELKTDIRSHLPTTLISRSVASHWRPGSRALTYLKWRLEKAGISESSDIAETAQDDNEFLVSFCETDPNCRPAPYDAVELASFLERCLRTREREGSLSAELLGEAKARVADSGVRSALAEVAAVDATTGERELRVRIIRAWAQAVEAEGAGDELTDLAIEIASRVGRPASEELIALAEASVSNKTVRVAVAVELERIDALIDQTERLDLIEQACKAGVEAGGDPEKLATLRERLLDLALRPIEHEWGRAVREAADPQRLVYYLAGVVSRDDFAVIQDSVSIHVRERKLETMLTLERLIEDIADLAAEAD